MAGVAAYGFQIIGGRTLGDEGFAPVAALLSVHSLILAVLLTPVELLTVRRLALARGGAPDYHDRRSILIALAAAEAAMLGFVAIARDRLFAGEPAFLLVGGAVVATHGLFALARGALAGRARYLAYGFASGGAAVVRLALALFWAGRNPDAVDFAWMVALPPLLVLALRPFRRSDRRVPARTGSGALMAGFVLAGAISQAFVLAGPLVAGLIEHDRASAATTVSVVFVTFSLARAPLLIAQNLAARLLAALSTMAARKDHEGLKRWAARFVAATALAAVPSFAAGSLVGPDLIGWLFGPEFRPSGLLAGLAVASCVIASGSVFLDQVLVALGATGRLAAAWTGALVAAGAVVAVGPWTADLRVGWAVLCGEVVALLAVAVAVSEQAPGKRIFDLAVGGGLLVLTAPLQALLALAVKFDTPGPALHRQIRIGLDERPFVMFKFRTMGHGASDEPLRRHLADVASVGRVGASGGDAGSKPLWIDGDHRVTRVGRFLRRTSLDELPNLWNVLKGDMSLVGPRPLVPEEAALLDQDARRRHQVRPGMTGLAQIHGASEATFGERAYWDLRYVEERSFWLDLRILAATPRAALRRR